MTRLAFCIPKLKMGATHGSLKSATHKLIYDASKKSDYARKPLGILSIEVGSAMQKILELWDEFSGAKLEHLRRSIENDEYGYMCGNSDLRWRISGLERTKEIDTLCASVVHMGSFCQNKKLHNLDMVFSNFNASEDSGLSNISSKHSDELNDYMRSMVTLTASLFDEMQVLHNMLPRSHPLKSKGISYEVENWGESVMTSMPYDIHEKVFGQVLIVTRLQGLSLWNCDRDETIEFLVLATCVLRKRLVRAFGKPTVTPEEISNSLIATGLASHYAHIIVGLDKMVQRPTQVLAYSRVNLYNKLPSSLKHLLRQRLERKKKVFDIGVASHLKECTISLLQSLLPLAEMTLDWCLENSFNQKFSRKSKVLQVQTLFYARRDKIELLLAEILTSLSYISRPIDILEFQDEEELSQWNTWVNSEGDMIIDTGFQVA